MQNFIQLEKDDVLRLGIKTSDGKETGEYLEFDLEDIELPLKFQELVEKDKKNKEWLRNQFLIIDKREDVKGKKILSRNEEDKIKALNTFLNKETEIYDMFLGKDGVKKLLNGGKLKWTSLNSIDNIIEKQILPYLNLRSDLIADKIKKKYSETLKKEKDILNYEDMKNE